MNGSIWVFKGFRKGASLKIGTSGWEDHGNPANTQRDKDDLPAEKEASPSRQRASSNTKGCRENGKMGVECWSLKSPPEHAIGKLVPHGSLACRSSGLVPRRHYCLGPERTSQSSLCVSCCVCCTRRSSGWRLAVGTAQPVEGNRLLLEVTFLRNKQDEIALCFTFENSLCNFQARNWLRIFFVKTLAILFRGIVI